MKTREQYLPFPIPKTLDEAEQLVANMTAVALNDPTRAWMLKLACKALRERTGAALVMLMAKRMKETPTGITCLPPEEKTLEIGAE